METKRNKRVIENIDETFLLNSIIYKRSQTFHL
jgi:hypothetical protein